jgi:hypothetical protein
MKSKEALTGAKLCYRILPIIWPTFENFILSVGRAGGGWMIANPPTPSLSGFVSSRVLYAIDEFPNRGIATGIRLGAFHFGGCEGEDGEGSKKKGRKHFGLICSINSVHLR